MSLILSNQENTMEYAFKSTDLAPDERAAVERLLGRPLENDETVAVVTRKTNAGASVRADERPIWEVILDNMKDVPPEDLAVLPRDGASQIDHYIYGLPKTGE
jgi:hypothetical protein